MDLKQLGFTNSACGPFTKNKERIQKFKETRDKTYIFKNELDKACFKHDMALGDLAKMTVKFHKLLKNKAFNIAKNLKYDGYQRGLASVIYNAFDKKPKTVVLIKKSNKLNNWLKILHKPIIRKSKERIVYFSYKDNIWGVNLADMQLISKV